MDRGIVSFLKILTFVFLDTQEQIKVVFQNLNILGSHQNIILVTFEKLFGSNQYTVSTF